MLRANEPGPYGIGSRHWPGVGKVQEEMSELGTVLGKLMGSGGLRQHWSGDLVQMMRDEIADVRAALDHLEECNPLLAETVDYCGRGFMDGDEYVKRRHEWKLDLFRSWARGDKEELWPKPEQYGLPPRIAA